MATDSKNIPALVQQKPVAWATQMEEYAQLNHAAALIASVAETSARTPTTTTHVTYHLNFQT